MAMRALKPCVFARLRLLGWYVRFIRASENACLLGWSVERMIETELLTIATFSGFSPSIAVSPQLRAMMGFHFTARKFLQLFDNC